VIRAVMQEVLEAEMDEALGASKGERTPERLGYRSGYYGRTLVTRVGKLELRVPQDRAGRFSTELFERYQRSERALVATLAEMYVQGVSTGKQLVQQFLDSQVMILSFPSSWPRAQNS
jgi:putative transposase